jgi:hypothetical protein
MAHKRLQVQCLDGHTAWGSLNSVSSQDKTPLMPHSLYLAIMSALVRPADIGAVTGTSWVDILDAGAVSLAGAEDILDG